MPWGDGRALAQLLRENGFGCSEAAECALGVTERTVVRLDGIERVTHHNGNLNGVPSLDPVAGPRRRRDYCPERTGAALPELFGDQHKQDVIAVLARLRLPFEDSTCALRIDRDIRDYFLGMLRGR
jgi:hypothetical protein